MNEQDCSGSPLIFESDHAEEQPAFDRADFMERVMEDAALAQDVIRGYYPDLQRQLALIDGFWRHGHAAGVEHHAHTLKGAAGNLGAPALQEAAQGVEEYARLGNLGAAGAGLAELRFHVQRLRAALAAEFPEAVAGVTAREGESGV